ncbi:bifunctional diaminohydroxyphosphoribosylaminopyrimidine deaminase/5-amino-6-(5-phosphoribosylamino)uracil reductase RibD [Candidatus Pandoraea novymonadis]|uniref:Riboflavin biosynthesis protein RibD n=1 Tax=Candidatus Pandoraea novymonadis TaxID=1808959 RepID=A0ABX5FEK4_9BURK|nr:bifunctional diaminohydroxyphosphoribosylaminopyrimidine deaminase/5-amino-6-(5-phosphoribosylamino)uracil reductase RibD [Candidatus Pandoraea novymonadis]PSB92139.1 Riboflavin biosynthesis protein RibD [Candidatus Pandoraea novymonadis]
MFSDQDFDFMRRALSLAEQSLWTASPNPRVGCVIVSQGRIIGEGWTQPPGKDHAEIHAIKDAKAKGFSVYNSTAYVTLEPCSHFGRTPPCADTLINYRIQRVIAAMEDPNPQVAGRGLARLRAAGIQVHCGLLEKEAHTLNIGFVSRMLHGRPWVRIKIAASLDGKTALHNGVSQWITGEAARVDGHAWRARSCAILTGIGTVRQDDPAMTVRAVNTSRHPLRVLVDSQLSVAPFARILADRNVLVVCANALPNRIAFFRSLGIELLNLPNADGKVDLPKLIYILGERQVNELHVEAGFKLSGSLLREKCVDEILTYFAPCLLGDAQGMFNLQAVAELNSRVSLQIHDARMIGDDLRILARVRRT